MRAVSKHYVLAAKSNQLRSSQAGLDGDKQEGAIAPADPRGSLRGGDERLDFRGSEELDGPALETFAWNGENPLAEKRKRGLGQSHVLEEAVDGRQPRVARTGAVSPPTLEVIEKLRQERRVEVFDGELRGRLVQVLICEAQQQTEGVAIGSDRMSAPAPLPNEAVHEETLQERLEAHNAISRRRISRSVASWSNSGTASMYQ